MFGSIENMVFVMAGETELGRTAVIHLNGPAGTEVFNQLFEHGWALAFEDGVIYFAPAWAQSDPLEIHVVLPWTPEVWGVQDGTRWMSLKDNGRDGASLLYGDGCLLYATMTDTPAEA